MPERAREKGLDGRAIFVFEGTVRRLRAANVPEVEVTARTVVVSVDRIIRGPKLLKAYAGREITVQLSAGEILKKGARARFYANPWLFGEGVAVESIGHTEVEGQARAHSIVNATTDPAQAGEEQALRAHLDEADVVVRGRVTAVRMPPETGPKRGGLSNAPTRPVSEHSGHWREALIEVEGVEKGEHPHAQLIVRFPSSRDVRWANAPKFEPGQRGLFILHSEEGAEEPHERGPRARPAATKKRAGPQVYTALHAGDFQPAESAPDISRLVKPASRKKASPAKKERR